MRPCVCRDAGQLVATLNPIQQGLKLRLTCHPWQFSILVATLNPIQQGLKLQNHTGIKRLIGALQR